MTLKILVLDNEPPTTAYEQWALSTSDVNRADIVLAANGRILKDRTGDAQQVIRSLNGDVWAAQGGNRPHRLGSPLVATKPRPRPEPFVFWRDFNIIGWDQQPARYPIFGRYREQIERAFGAGGHALRGWDIL